MTDINSGPSGMIMTEEFTSSQSSASAVGRIVETDIQNLTTYHTDLEIINYVVMPNHVHMILSITPSQRELSAPAELGCLKPPRHGEPVDDFHHNSRLATIVGTFKAGVTRQARTRRISSLPGDKIWQSRFHEHIIRNQHAFDNIMNYIDSNMRNWCHDKFNSNRIEWPVGTRFFASADSSATTERVDNKCNNSADAKNRVPTTRNNHEA